MLALGKNVGNVGSQDGGDVAKHRDRHDVSSQSRSKLKVLTAEQLDEEVGNHFGRAGVLNAHGENGAQHNGDAHAAQRTTEARGDLAQNLRKGKTIRLKYAHDQAHGQSRGEQRERGMQFDLHDQNHQ